MTEADRSIIADAYLSEQGYRFLEELVTRFGARFAGSLQEQQAADFIQETFSALGAGRTFQERFKVPGWSRQQTILRLENAQDTSFPCIALPFCPPGDVTGRLVFLGDGHPQAYLDAREEIRGAIVMVTTATPRFYHRTMHRGEKLGRALEAGAAGFIWMRGEPGGLEETGSARFGRFCEVPAISVSYETGMELVRRARHSPLSLTIQSTNQNHMVESSNVILELLGQEKPEERIVIGAHYDGHDISQGAMDDGAGIAVVTETARLLAPHRQRLKRSVHFVAFAQEEMGLLGSEDYVTRHGQEDIRFMINLDGAGRGSSPLFELQGWPELTRYFKAAFQEMFEPDVAVGDRIFLYSDMYPFAAQGLASCSFISQDPNPASAPRGYGHTSCDTLDKVRAKPIQLDAARTARLALKLAEADDLPFTRKTPANFAAHLREMGLDEVLRYERRAVPGE